MSWDQVEEEMENVEKIVQAMEIDEKKEDPIELGARPKETSKVEVTSEVMKSGGGRILQPSLSGSEPGTVIRTSTDVGSPPSYRRFSSPRPPRFTIERKMSAGILRTSPAERGRKKSGGGQSAEPTSPAPSVDRLSVTFADIENQKEDNPEKVETLPQPDSGEVNAELTVEAIEVLGADVVATLGQPSEEYTDSILELQRSKSRGSNVVSQDPSGRRRSSGGGHHRRGSSMSSSILQGGGRHRFSSSGGRTSSSGESLISSSRSRSSAVSRCDLEALKLHNELIEQAKYQSWPLDKKLRVVQQAKEYVKKHESEMEERLAQSKTFASRLRQVHLYIFKFLGILFKFIKDVLLDFTPWQQRIKDIESHFGSVVSSYFVFLRWIFWMNFAITLVLTVFVIIPEVLAADWVDTGARKKMLPVEEYYAYNLKVMWDFEGILRYSPIFYGYYSDKTKTSAGYRIPLAYFCAGMAVYVFSFAIILKKMAQNNKQSKLSEKGDECTFTWKVYASWDYGIANIETAHNKVASITMGFREALVEEMEKEKEQDKNWRVTAKRITANFLFVICLIGTAYAVIFVVERSTQPEADSSWYRQNEITIAMNLIGIIVPGLFDLICLLENYHPRKAMRLMLGRIMALNLLSLYTLIFALFGKTEGMISTLMKMEEMKNAGRNFGLETVTQAYDDPKDCFNIPIDCQLIHSGRVNIPPPIHSLQMNEPFYEFNDKPTMNNTIVMVVASNNTMEDNCTFCLDKCFGCSCFDLCGELNGTENYDNCTDCYDGLWQKEMEEEPTSEIPEVNILFNGLSDDEVEEEFGIVPLNEDGNENTCIRKICRRRFYGTKKPPEIPQVMMKCEEAKSKYYADLKEKLDLRKLCWETMFGQELVKLTVMDTVFTLMSILIGDFGRSLFLRVMNPCWFWDLEQNFPKYPDFKVAENILHLVNNQGMIWMGLFMAPGLPAINLVKLAIIMYSRSWAVMTTNVPHETVFRASRSNNFYFVLLLMMLFLCTLPVAYTIVWLKPSWHCGPFSRYDRMYLVFTHKLLDILPEKLHGILDYITSPGIVIPTLVLMVLIIYYLTSLTGLLRESNNDLKNQLHHERTEERRKLVKGNKDDASRNVHEKWRKILGSAMSQQQAEREDQRVQAEKLQKDVEASKDETFNERAVDVPDAMVELQKIDKKQEQRHLVVVKRPTSELSFQSINEISSIGEPNPDEHGSLCNRFNFDNIIPNTKPIQQQPIQIPKEVDESSKKPPKIWISKSASMDDDLD